MKKRFLGAIMSVLIGLGALARWLFRRERNLQAVRERHGYDQRGR
jgi:hypothetical protein